MKKQTFLILLLGLLLPCVIYGSLNSFSSLEKDKTDPIELIGALNPSKGIRSANLILTPITAERQGNIIVVLFKESMGNIQISITNEMGEEVYFQKVNIFDCMDAYYESYTKGDKRMIKAAIKRFKDFIALEYPLYETRITAEQIDKKMIEKFVEYLQSISKGEGALTHYKRFKKIIKYMVEEDYIRKNPCLNVTCKADEGALKKDVLSIEEMKQLISTTYPQQNENVRRAFIFCLYTGIRYCDVKDLQYSNVDYSNKFLTFNQKKTQGHSSKSWLNIPLNDMLLQLIGKSEVSKTGEMIDGNIFILPSQTMCLRSLKYWVKRDHQ